MRISDQLKIDFSVMDVRTLEDLDDREDVASVAFGLGSTVSPDLFLTPGNILRFGIPPMRLEILNEISGVSFQECWDSHEYLNVRDIEIPIISIEKASLYFLSLKDTAVGLPA